MSWRRSLRWLRKLSRSEILFQTNPISKKISSNPIVSQEVCQARKLKRIKDRIHSTPGHLIKSSTSSPTSPLTWSNGFKFVLRHLTIRSLLDKMVIHSRNMRWRRHGGLSPYLTGAPFVSLEHLMILISRVTLKWSSADFASASKIYSRWSCTTVRASLMMTFLTSSGKRLSMESHSKVMTTSSNSY